MSLPGRKIDRTIWNRVEEIFHEAVEMPESRRKAWLAAQAVDPAILNEVESLLKSWQRNQELPPEDQAPGDLQPNNASAARFGPYEAVRLIGRGGMGAVYLARRADGQFEQIAAVKVIAAHLAGGESISRFHTERQLLASLNHPNITRLLDGGVLPSGDPYLVMEYVEGEPLDHYCDSHKLGIEARLRLFLQVSEAVEYAHRSLIVHRDLKPGNILVTAGGMVKLLDFGTAALAVQSIDVTATRSPMVTPRYASPERMRGERANTANDVFSLGVILYELLTGAWPYGDPDSMINELKRAVGDATPTAPAAVLTAEAAERRGLTCDRLRRTLEGDLSAIVLKAIESDPARRFRTVRELAEDIERFLSGRPVHARAQTAWYRTWKFVRRRWIPVTAALLVMMAIVGAAIVSMRETSVARAEARRSAAANRFLGDIISSAAPQSFDPNKFTVTELLDQAAARLEGAFPNDPRIEADLRQNLGTSYAAMFQFEKARVQLAKALSIFRSLRDPEGIMYALRSSADVDSNAGRKEASVALYRETLTWLNRLGVKDYAGEMAYVKRQLALDLYWLNRDLDDASKLNEDVIALGLANRAVSRLEVAKAMCQKADLLLQSSPDQEQLYRKALAIGRQEQPGGLWEGNALGGLAAVYAARRDFNQAKEYARQRYELFLKYHGPNRASTAAAKISWALHSARAGDLEQGLRLVKEGVPVAVQGFPPDSLRLWRALNDAGVTCNLAMHPRDGEAYARDALALVDRAHLPALDYRRASSLFTLGVALQGQHRIAESIKVLKESETIYRQISGMEHSLAAVRETLRKVDVETK